MDGLGLGLEPDRGGGWDVGSGLVGLYSKGTLAGQLFVFLRNWLALVGAVHPGLPRC